MDSSLANRFVHSDTHTGCAGVAVAIYIDEDLLGGGAQPFTDSTEDALIGLMRDHAANLLNG